MQTESSLDKRLAEEFSSALASEGIYVCAKFKHSCFLLSSRACPHRLERGWFKEAEARAGVTPRRPCPGAGGHRACGRARRVA